MLLFISPAKTLDFESDIIIGEVTKPYFLQEAEKINKSLRKKSRKALAELQGISPSLAGENYVRNQEWAVVHEEKVKQAVLAFKGDVYLGLRADKWGKEEMVFANDHLRILSGLYGILKPSDVIMPYRLEMGTKLKVGRREDLYEFWGDKLKTWFKKEISPDRLILNLASKEYFKAIKKTQIKNPILDVEFKDFHQGEYKIMSFFAKRARGLMADFIIRNKLRDKEGMKAFDSEGYYFDEKSSSDEHYVFLRTEKK